MPTSFAETDFLKEVGELNDNKKHDFLMIRNLFEY